MKNPQQSVKGINELTRRLYYENQKYFVFVFFFIIKNDAIFFLPYSHILEETVAMSAIATMVKSEMKTHKKMLTLQRMISQEKKNIEEEKWTEKEKKHNQEKR